MTEIDRLRLSASLTPRASLLGGNLFAVTDSSGEPVVSFPGEEGAGTIMQGYTESSNVSGSGRDGT